MPKTDQQKAEKLYLEGGSSYSILAKKFKVSERTVKRWAEVGNWQAKKKSLDIASESVAARLSEELQEPVYPRTVKARYSELDSEQYYETALADITVSAPDAPARSKEALYLAGVKIHQAREQSALLAVDLELKRTELELKKADLELKRRQLNPPELDGLIDMILGFGYTPKEMVEILRRKLGK